MEPQPIQSGAIGNPVAVNRLAKEKSPYLLQHQHNPVDWNPWGEEAFAEARALDRPIFLSIGYSTCHWCHVMERESFENAQVAEYLNAHFISIKVDREERPDVDKIYMTAVQAFSGQGGWPLNAFLTPDLKPFYCGTYFPPDSRHGLPGFLSLLRQIQQVWTTRRHDILHSTAELHKRLQQSTRPESSQGMVLSPALLHDAAALFSDQYDEHHGGFGPAPKFPRPSLPMFLLRYGTRFHDEDAVDMVLNTCDHMAAGGIHDHLGGGFARYSVDESWTVPHFEKMLYDNALLAHLYIDTFLASSEPRFADTANGIFQYILKDMTHPEGGFYSAEDADSEGREGKFYCWTMMELRQLLSPEELALATRYFKLSDEGNFIDHSDPNPLTGQNVLCISNPAVSDAERPTLESALKKMSAARSRRVRPHLDDKVLASWNGLMLGAFARGGISLRQPLYLQAAEKTAAFLKKRLWDAQTGVLYHRWRDGQRDNVQLLDAYAFLLSGLLCLYEATLQTTHLQFACRLADKMIELFYDAELGGFWQTPAGDPHLILRFKEDYDGAEPSGNSIAILVLIKLAAITGNTAYNKAAENSLRLFTPHLFKLPQAAPHMLIAMDAWFHEPTRIVIAGDPNSPEAKALLQTAHSVYRPGTVILGNSGPVDGFSQLLRPRHKTAEAFLCTATGCQEPTGDPVRLLELLKAIHA
jgi:uncharacterized protein